MACAVKVKDEWMRTGDYFLEEKLGSGSVADDGMVIGSLGVIALLVLLPKTCKQTENLSGNNIKKGNESCEQDHRDQNNEG